MGKPGDVRRLAELHRQGVLTREEFNYRRQVAKWLPDSSPVELPAGRMVSQHVALTRERLAEQHRRGQLSDGEYGFRRRMQDLLEQGELSWPTFRQAMVERLADTGHDVTDWQPPAGRPGPPSTGHLPRRGGTKDRDLAEPAAPDMAEALAPSAEFDDGRQPPVDPPEPMTADTDHAAPDTTDPASGPAAPPDPTTHSPSRGRRIVAVVGLVLIAAFGYNSCQNRQLFDYCFDRMWDQGFRGDDLNVLVQACIDNPGPDAP